MANRQYTAQDAEQINQAQEHFRAKGLADDQFQSAIDLLRDYFEANPGVPITTENVVKVVEERKQDFKWLTTAELQYRNLSAGLNEDQKAALYTFVKNNDLEVAGDSGVRNQVEILSWLQRSGHPVNWNSLTLALGNVQNSQRGKYLVWRKRLQDSEKEELRRRSEQSPFAKPAEQEGEKSWRDKSRHPDPTLQHHKEMMGRPAETVAPDPAAEAARLNNEWKQKAEALEQTATVDGRISYLDQDQIRRIKFYQGTEVDWQATYFGRLNYIQKRTTDRANAGRW